jgi:hypothetical protein
MLQRSRRAGVRLYTRNGNDFADSVEGAEHGREVRGPGTDQLKHREPSLVASRRR